MKKIRVWIIFAIMVVLAAGICYIRLPEYKVYWSFINEGEDYRETNLYVIVYKLWNIEDTVEMLVAEHNRMNGVPDKMNVRLYRSRYDVEHGKEFYETTYDYGEDEVKPPPGV